MLTMTNIVIALMTVTTNYLPICEFQDLHHSIGRQHPDVRMNEKVYLRQVVTNLTYYAPVYIKEERKGTK